MQEPYALSVMSWLTLIMDFLVAKSRVCLAIVEYKTPALAALNATVFLRPYICNNKSTGQEITQLDSLSRQ